MKAMKILGQALKFAKDCAVSVRVPRTTSGITPIPAHPGPPWGGVKAG